MPSGLRQIAKPCEPVGGATAVRIRKLGDDVTRAELRRRLELGNELLGLERRVHAEELDVVHAHARSGHPGFGRLHQGPIARQVVQRLGGGDAGHAQADIAIARFVPPRR